MRWPLAVVGLSVFWGLALTGLTVLPMHQDEPWIASTGAQLAQTGVYGSAMFAGYYGADQHYYLNMPAYAIVQAGVFRMLGVGVFQMRLVSVMAGLLVAALTLAVARQLGGESVSVVALGLLMVWRLAHSTGTGLPLVDAAQLARYDVAVPVFTLAAVWVFDRADSVREYLLVGGLIGLAALFNVYGGFVLPVLLVAWTRRHGRSGWRRAAPYLMLLGCAAMAVLWLAYAAAHWPEYVGQSRFHAAAYDVFNPQFYLNNLAREIERFGDLRPWQGSGVWLAAIALPIALVGLIAHARRHGNRLGLIAWLVVGQQALFGLLLAAKTPRYFVAVWPYAVIALAWLGVTVWRRWQAPIVRGGLVVCAAMLLIDGGGAIWQRRLALASTTPYTAFIARVAELIPPNARVLGLHTYWLGLRQFDYHTWLVPLLLADARYVDAPLPFDAALAKINANVILIDPAMRQTFAAMARPGDVRRALFDRYQAYLEQTQARLVGEVDDVTYGLMQVYVVQPSAWP